MYQDTTQNNAQTIKTSFSRSTTISIQIDADLSIIWTLLTNANDYHRWNSTIISLEGKIAEGEKIRLRSTLDERRTFRLKVATLIPEKMMTWKGNGGERVFKLENLGNGQVNFTMSEKIGGLLFPLYAGFIPPFDENFEKFANDLKSEAEIISKSS